MNFNLILLGYDLDYMHEFSDNIFQIAKFDNLISLHNIRKTINDRKYAKEYLSRALFYEEIEKKGQNNIIIPGIFEVGLLKELKSYTSVNSKLSNTSWIVGVMSSSYIKYADTYSKSKILNRQANLPDALISASMMEDVEFQRRRKHLEDVYYKKYFTCAHFLNRVDDDVYSNTINLTNFLVEKQFTELLREE